MAVIVSSQNVQILYENRFCKQDDFDIIISGNHNDLENTKVRSTLRISYPEFEEIETFYFSPKYSGSQKTICERSSIWMMYNTDILYKTNTTAKDLFSDFSKLCFHKNDQWINLILLPDKRVRYSACSFMKCLYVFGGYSGDFLRSCLKYDTKTSKWTNIANMNNCKEYAACTAFEGKIVVSGGDNLGKLKSVEAYDHHENHDSNLVVHVITK